MMGQEKTTDILHGIDVFYRGSRDYIQGSLITSGALAKIGDLHQGADVTLTRVRFKQICNRPIALTSNPEYKSQAFGDIFCMINGVRTQFLFVEVDGPAPERREDSLSQIIAFEDLGHMNCKAQIVQPNSIDEVLSAIVETVKLRVKKSFPGARDIWFTELSGAEISLTDWKRTSAPLTLTVTSETELNRDGRVITRSGTSFVLDDETVRSAKITFTHVQ